MELTVQKREILGKKIRSLRRDGLIPAELYGHGFENIHLSVPVKDFSKVFKEAGESTIINLVLSGVEGSTVGDDKFPVLVHDVEFDSLSDKINHIDFVAVRMDEKITATVPLEFIGEAPAVKEKDGVLIKAVKEIELETLPVNLPHSIAVDVVSLVDIGSVIRVGDLKINSKVKLLVDSETVIATIIGKAAEEEVVPEVKIEDVKVEGEEKKKEKEKEKGESVE